MISRQLWLVICLTVISTGYLQSQAIYKPNSALKSHETLEISKVEITPQKTVIFLSLENRIMGGYFCAGKNIFIIYPDGTRRKLISSEGIPVCPETYKFKSIGEKLLFRLEFPPIKAGTKWVDIFEDCQENCFWFYGVTLDIDLNKKLDEGFSYVDKGETIKAITLYKEVLGSVEKDNTGIEGALFTNLISLSLETGDRSAAEKWYKMLLLSKAPHASLYIRNLNDRGIKY